MRFFSDNTGTACPEILAAIHEANHGLARAYGDDDWTERLDGALSAHFGTPVRAFAVTTGTAANSLALAGIAPREHAAAALASIGRDPSAPKPCARIF